MYMRSTFSASQVQRKTTAKLLFVSALIPQNIESLSYPASSESISSLENLGFEYVAVFVAQDLTSAGPLEFEEFQVVASR